MNKVLRSRIQEYFPIQLRVELELMSRQRSQNKGDAIYSLLQKYVKQDLTRLGPGTNRYAVRLGGYVFKFATDHDGKIDNLKEFKMGDRLYPYVARTYEVSSNGTILVAEYVEPFTSYAEMLTYGDQIRTILKKLSTRYLIGDIGITGNNYLNWGLRVGTNEPVCLDFAYVYDINSDLFMCKKCKNNAILIPDQNFVELVCPVCHNKTSFSDIRGRIGNDVHDHEIGDLSEEGYLMTEPSTTITLDPKRSKYLKIQEEEAMKIKDINGYEELMLKLAEQQRETLPEDFQVKPVVQGHVIGVTNSETPVSTDLITEDDDDDIEFEDDFFTFDDDDDDDDEEEWDDDEEWDEDDEDDESSLAFSGKINHTRPEVVQQQLHDSFNDWVEKGGPLTKVTEEKAADILNNMKEQIVDNNKKIVFKMPEEDHPVDTVSVVKAKIVGEITDKIRPVTEKISDAVETVSDYVADKADEIKDRVGEAVGDVADKMESAITPAESPALKPLDERFLKYSMRAVSKICNKIGEYWKGLEIFGEDGEKVDIWNTLKDHINRGKTKKINGLNELIDGIQSTLFRSVIDFCGYKEISTDPRVWELVDAPEEALPTIRFIETYWITRPINALSGSELIEKFAEVGIGFQPELRSVFKNRLLNRNGFDEFAAETVTEWFLDPLIVGDPILVEEPETAAEQPTQAVEADEDNPVAVIEDLLNESEHEHSAVDINTAGVPLSEIVMTPVEAVEDDDDDDSSSMIIRVINDGDFDRMTVVTYDDTDAVVIPLYVDPEHVSPNVPYMADERNGNWEWLAHFVPDDVHHIIGDFQPGVRKISDEGFYTVEIILDEYEGKLIVGSYESIEFMTDREINDELLDYINRVICNEIGTSMVSALAMTVRSAIGDTDDVSSDDDSTDDTTADYAAEYMRSYVDEDEDDDDHRTFQPLHKKRHVEDEE